MLNIARRLAFNKQTAKRAIVALIVAQVIWGLSTPINKQALEIVDPLFYVAMRFSLAAFFIAPWALVAITSVNKDVLRKTLLYSLFTASALTLGIVALSIVHSINASVMSAFVPVLTSLVAIRFLKEPVVIKKVIGMGIGLVGVMLIVTEPLFEGAGFSFEIIGNLIFMTSIILGVLGSVLKKPLLKQVDAIAMAFITFALTALMGWVLFLARGVSFQDQINSVNLTVAVALVYSVFFVAILAFWLYFYALNNMLAEDTAAMAYIDPIVGVIGAAVLLGETASSTFLVGSMMVLMGIYAAEAHLKMHKIHFFHKLHK